MNSGIRVLWRLYRGSTCCYHHLSVGHYSMDGQIEKAIIRYSQCTALFSIAAPKGEGSYNLGILGHLR